MFQRLPHHFGRRDSSLLFPGLAAVGTEFIAVNQRDIVIRRTSVAGRILDRKLAQRVPVAAHAYLARSRGSGGMSGLVVEGSGIPWQVVCVAGGFFTEHVEAVSDVRENPRLGLVVAVLHDGFAEDELRS
jgi:hypothetical protein